ncbi:MAG: helix-turn-helix transcriptional regulator, partial [Actinomycetota bacterium]|nr:helix-turn-helix transcriptional regulator [Actinomycetota bacterium]
AAADEEAREFLTAFESRRVSTAPAQKVAEHGLTRRELEVLRLIATGASNAEIAATLFVGERTVKGHVGSIFAKLGTRDRAAAIVLAYEAGVIVPGVAATG